MPQDNIDFDPLAAFDLMQTSTENSTPEESPFFEIPVSLDVLAAGPSSCESPSDLVARAAVAAGPLLHPCRPVRTADDPRVYALPPPPPYPFDGSNHLNTAAIARLAVPATDLRNAQERQAAAALLVREYESRHGTNLAFPDALDFWWKSARRCVDISAAFNRPGVSPNALLTRAIRLVAFDFADAQQIYVERRARLFDESGIPVARDSRGRLICPPSPYSSFIF